LLEEARPLPDSGQIHPDVRKDPSARADRSRTDRRVERTRAALLQAFNALVTQRRYGAIRIADIVETANVGRSTFYEHFRTRDDILLVAMAPLFGRLSEAVAPPEGAQPLNGLIAHFWDKRALARLILAPPVEPKLRRALAAAIEARLPIAANPTKRQLAATAIAAGQLGLLAAWIRGELSATADEIAEMILAIGRIR
jgi:AcrR family transcriptional regulator